MKILFCITVFGHGKGGHFFSLRSIAESLSTEHEVLLANLGSSFSPVFSDGALPCRYIPYHGWDYFAARAKLASLIKNYQPDVVHAFDVASYAVARMATQAPTKLVLTKCGGPNPRIYYPYASDLILFSQENYDFFSQRRRWRNAHLALIPNRVQAVRGDNKRVAALREKHGLQQEKILMRISRISPHYRSSFIQGINLASRLAAMGIPLRLLLLGVVQSPELKLELQARIAAQQLESLVIWEDDAYFTDNAAELLPLADAVIGSGRGFMEAASLNKLLLAIAAEGACPIGVTDENFMEIFATNCSPRSRVTQFSEGANLQWIAAALQGRVTVNSRQWFDSYFSAERVRSLYPDFYQRCKPRRWQGIDAVLNALYAVRERR